MMKSSAGHVGDVSSVRTERGNEVCASRDRVEAISKGGSLEKVVGRGESGRERKKW